MPGAIIAPVRSHAEEEYRYAEEHVMEWDVMMWILLSLDLVTLSAVQVSLIVNWKCIVYPFVVDGGWSDYTSEGPCSVTCGSGCKSFSRNCTNPLPSCGGKDCDGPTIVMRQCDLQPCAVLRKFICKFDSTSSASVQLRIISALCVMFSHVANHDLTPGEIEKILGRLNREQTVKQFMFEVLGEEVGKAIFKK